MSLTAVAVSYSELSHLGSAGIIREDFVEMPAALLRGGDVKRLYKMHREGHSARAIAWEMGLSRNTMLKYLRSPEAIRPKARRPWGPTLDSFSQHIDRRWAEGLESCVFCCGGCGPWAMKAHTAL